MKHTSESCCILVLAAGSSSRMGTSQQLLDYKGEPLLRHAIEVALAACCAPVLVVLGSGASEVDKALKGLAVETVVNQRWREGMGTSIQAGLVAMGQHIQEVIITLGDQPLVTPDYLRRVRDIHGAEKQPIVPSRYSGTVGVPVLFARSAFPTLMALAPDQGCKSAILKNQSQAILVDCPEAAFDIDTPDDYARLAPIG